MSKNLRDFRILIIEDDEDVGDLIKTSLISMLDFPMHIDLFDNAEEALSRLKYNKYDFVISDYKLPGISGLEFIVHFRKCPQGRKIPIILLSGYFADLQSDKRLKDLDGVICMRKPFEIERLTDTINNTYLKVFQNQV